MANSRYVSLAELTSMVYISCTLLASCPATPPCSPRDVNVSASALSFSQAVSMSSSTKTFSGVFLDLAMPVAWLAMVAKFPFNTRAKAAAQSRSSMKIFLAKLRSDTTWASVYSRYWIQTLAWTWMPPHFMCWSSSALVPSRSSRASDSLSKGPPKASARVERIIRPTLSPIEVARTSAYDVKSASEDALPWPWAKIAPASRFRILNSLFLLSMRYATFAELTNLSGDSGTSSC
mmetsp:Transcript_9614/g.29259  ORF Transcript_9614/g.29259 Transcript_9614/m.29259 type:complete len:234 (-) Transcript_9614:736-1437(-)